MGYNWFNIINYDLYHFHQDIAKHLKGDLLDIGCGQKQEVFKNKVKKYVGLDNSSTLKVNKTNEVTEADVFGDATALPFKDKTFDCVTALSLIEHVPEPQKVIDEAYRVLKKGGIFAVTCPFMNRIHTAPYDYFRFTEYGLRYMLEKSGFKIIKIEDGGGMWKMMGARLAGYFYSDLLGIGYGEDDAATKPKKYLLPFFLPIIAFVVVMGRFLDKVHTVKKDTLHYYALCKKVK